MTNDDLKRFYNVNEKPEQNKDFVRYGSNGEIISEHDATKDEEVVNYRTLMQHASGGSSSLYLHHIKISGYNGTFTLINDDPTAYTMTSLGNYLKNKGYSNVPLDGFAYQLTSSYSTVGITFIYGFTFSGNDLVANFSNIFWNLTDGNINAREGGVGTKYVSISSDFVEQIL